MEKKGKVAANWLVFWIAWTGSTALGWGLAIFSVGSVYIVTAVWDPDKIGAYLQATPFERVGVALFTGSIIGIVLGIILGLLLWREQKRTVGALLGSIATVVGVSTLCSIASGVGPAEYVTDFSVAYRGGLVGGLLGGGISGLGQWMLLRRRWKDTSSWILWTMAGWTIGWLVISVGTIPIEGGATNQGLAMGTTLALTFATGAVSGLGQWWFLRGLVARAGWYVLAAAIGWSIGITVKDLGVGLPVEIPAIVNSIAIGGVPGAALVALLSQKDTPELESEAEEPLMEALSDEQG